MGGKAICRPLNFAGRWKPVKMKVPDIPAVLNQNEGSMRDVAYC